MATWATRITVTNLDAKLYDATGTRTDGEDKWEGTVHGLSADTHDSTPGAIVQLAISKIRAKYEAEVDKQAKVAVIVAQLEDAITAGLDALEA